MGTRYGTTFLYAQYCMSQRYPTSVLPGYCLQNVPGIWGAQAGYEAQCLYNAGFRPADRYGRTIEGWHDNGRRGHD